MAFDDYFRENSTLKLRDVTARFKHHSAKSNGSDDIAIVNLAILIQVGAVGYLVSSMELSVVIPTINSPTEIDVLPCLEACDFEDYEVIIRGDTPVTKARNEGYKRATAEKIVYLDDDSMPKNGYLSAAAETLEEKAAVAGRTIHPRNDMFAGQLTAHYDFGDDPRNVKYFWGCNMGIRRETLEAVGGWDERMGWGHEEKELADRVREQFNIYYNPEMVVLHPYTDSLIEYWKKHYRLEQETPYYLKKRGKSRREILSRILLDFIDPNRYLGRSPELMLARSGRTIAGTAGRLTGLFDERMNSFHEEGSETIGHSY